MTGFNRNFLYRIWKSTIKNVQLEIFIDFHRQAFEKPINFDFTGFSHVTMVEIEKSVPTSR